MTVRVLAALLLGLCTAADLVRRHGPGGRLADGGIARSAELGRFGLDGQWLIEGRGVVPDIEVDNPPRATFMGEDAQLAGAIRVLHDRLAADPVRVPKPQPYPAPARP